MRKSYHKRDDHRKFYRTNERIFAPSLRVIGSDGKQLGVFPKHEALVKAREEGLDLVEIAPKANPPVAKIVGFKKFLYQEEKKRREEKRKAKVSETKEIRLGPFMKDHDLNVMIRRARDFLISGDKVRLVVRFRGRQIVHPEFGQNIVKKTVASVSDVSKVDRMPHFEGKQLIALLSPERKKQHEAKNKEISTQTVQNN